MGKIIGRREEVSILNSVIAPSTPEFLAVYGRRRVGKTYLIRNFLENNEIEFFHCTGLKDGSMAEQLELFTDSMHSYFHSGIATPRTWMQAFKFFTESLALKQNKKIVMFLDELPWMASPRSRLLQALDYYWNTKWSYIDNFKLIICGSAASWIIKNILKSTGGLHNRVTEKIRLEPFKLVEVKDYLDSKNIKLKLQQIIEIYMAMGGVPFYLNKIEKNLSAAQNINNICFSKRGVLFAEYEVLFESLFKNSEVHDKIVRTLLQNKSGLTRDEIANKNKQISNNGRLTEKLNELEEAGFIQSFHPFGYKSKKTYYRIIDEYIIFYLQWIEPQKHDMLGKSAIFWENLTATVKYKAWSGYAFEAICYKHIDEIRRIIGLSSISNVASNWRYIARNKSEHGAQIDLLFDRFDNAITLCEIKFYNNNYTLDKKSYENIIKKQQVFNNVTKTHKQIFWCLISMYPITNNEYSESLISYNVTGEDLFCN